jgi:predicted DNA-binding transcriptional regulator AlpA
MARQAALPANLPPRLIGRELAAAYVSVSPNMFDKMVKDERMPKPKRLGPNRIAWDVRELDAAVDRLPTAGNDNTVDNTWEDVDAENASAAR